MTKLEVGPTGWRVYASIANASETSIMIFQPHAIPGAPIIYPHHGMSLVVSVAHTGRLASRRYTIISSRTFDPALPRVLPPHQTWTGAFGGSDAVPRKRKIYVGFGVFSADSRGLSETTARAIVVQ